MCLSPTLCKLLQALFNSERLCKVAKTWTLRCSTPQPDCISDWQLLAHIEKAGNVLDFGGTTTEENILNMHEIMYTNKCAIELMGVDILYTDSSYKGDFIVLIRIRKH